LTLAEEELRNRVGRLEDRYIALALKVEAVSTKMNILGVIGTVTLGTTITILIAVLFHQSV
jgi:hypothetical protein